jgi:hypothetical protein
MSKNEISLIDDIYSVIGDLFVYCHLKNYNEEDAQDMTQDQNIAISIMVFMIFMFSLIMFKVAFIIFYFVFVNVIPNVWRFFVKIVRKRCCMSFKTEIKYTFFYFGKIMKKIYTYNFYSYENKLIGFFMVSLYIIYIIFNLIFTVEYIKSDLKKEDKADYVKYEHIFAFELSVIIELIVCFFYITRNFKKLLIWVSSSFIILNGIIALVVVYKVNWLSPNEDPELPRRYASLFFSSYFSILLLLCLIRLIKYDPHCKFF